MPKHQVQILQTLLFPIALAFYSPEFFNLDGVFFKSNSINFINSDLVINVISASTVKSIVFFNCSTVI
jgi:hypothetical protein